MLTLLGPAMGRANRGGRPRADEGDRGTRQIRVFDDVGEMLSLLVRILGTSTAQLLDPMIRPDLESMCKRHEAEIAKIKEADEVVRKAQEQLRLAEESARLASAKSRRPRGS